MKQKWTWAFAACMGLLLTLLISGCGRTEKFRTEKNQTMTASGLFLAAQGRDACWVFTKNDITFSWFINIYDQVQYQITGTGNQDMVCDDIVVIKNLTWEGDFIWESSTGEHYTEMQGTVHVVGSNAGPGYQEGLDYYANWTATRRGDFIEGSVDGLGPFELKVQPFHYVEP